MTVEAIGHGGDASLRVRLETPTGQTIIYEDNEDRGIGLADVYWDRANPTRVGVLVCDGIAGDVVLGFDGETQQRLPGSAVIPGLRRILAARYSPPKAGLAAYGGDVLRWACDSRQDLYFVFERIVGPERRLPTLQVD